MKTLISALVFCLGLPPVFAQTKVDKHFPVQQGQQIVMQFDYPEMIRVSTWDKNEIQVQGTVSINSGENDDAFKLDSSVSGNTVTIRNEITDMKNIPHRYTVQDGTQKISFRSKEELAKYQAEKGITKFNWTSNGVDMDITLEIKVPKNMVTIVKSVYGVVEIKEFTGPLTVDATYGVVDAAITERLTGELFAETNFGEIYSNLDTKFGGQSKRKEDFHTYVSATPGTGPRYSFASKYGNVYLRKAAP